MRKIVLAGGTGFIGQFFEKRYTDSGYDVIHISRRPQHISWSDEAAIGKALDGAEMLINLAGKSVNCRYNEKNKREIMQSRTETTDILGRTIMTCDNPPPLWINASTATIYRHADDRPMTEADGEMGSGFSVDVATAWEASFFGFDLPRTRQNALRISIVLGEDGGVMTPYIRLVRFGLGGVQGSGDQMFSWIHVEDLYRIVLFLQENEQLQGVFNCAASTPISNREFMAQLRQRMGRKVGLPSPKWLLEMGAVMIGTETELVLKSRWVVPDRLEREGFQFTYDTIDKALKQILK